MAIYADTGHSALHVRLIKAADKGDILGTKITS